MKLIPLRTGDRRQNHKLGGAAVLQLVGFEPVIAIIDGIRREPAGQSAARATEFYRNSSFCWSSPMGRVVG
jgi:hypothetical protein